MRVLTALALAGLALGLAGCELAEVSSPAGEDVLVVESVLRTDTRRQILLLHRTLDDQVVGGEPNARVSVRTPDGREVPFGTIDPAVCTPGFIRVDSLRIEATCYASEPTEEPWVVPGGTYELRIDTPDGRSLRARTTVPGAFAFRSPALDPAPGEIALCDIPPRTELDLRWSRARGAWSYVANLRVAALNDVFELTGLAISETDTTLVLPTEFGIFERGELDPELLGELQGGFPPGAEAFLTLAAVDRNYVNAVRGGSFNPSGSVRVSSIAGDGVGVFGSLVPLRMFIRVRPGPTECRTVDPRAENL